MEEPAYLHDKVFREAHRGPHVTGSRGCILKSRDPSPQQIRKMAEAIRQHVPREKVGELAVWTWSVPMVQLAEIRENERF